MPKSPHKPLISALLGETPSRYPLWFMRQAGRYLPEYRELRKQFSFIESCQNPEMAAKITMQPLQRFDLDAAIIFSDILVPVMGMGLGLSFDAGHGPRISPCIREAKDLRLLKFPDAQKDLGYVGEALKLVKSQLAEHQTLIGFAGAPFTVATYMIEGSASKDYSHLKSFAFRDSANFVSLLEHVSAVTRDYVQMQIQAGAEVIMIFDTWASHLSPQDYKTLVYPMTRKLIQDIKKLGVEVIYFPGQGGSLIAEVGDIGASCISVDWRMSLTTAQMLLKHQGISLCLQGNLDPLSLLGDESFIRTKVRGILQEAKRLELKGHIFNVGHGLLPNIPISGLEWAIDEVRTWTKEGN